MTLRRYGLKRGIVMVSYCVDLTSVYSITVGKFALTSVSESFSISVLLFKRLSPLYVAISYSPLNIKSSAYTLDCKI